MMIVNITKSQSGTSWRSSWVVTRGIRRTWRASSCIFRSRRGSSGGNIGCCFCICVCAVCICICNYDVSGNWKNAKCTSANSFTCWKWEFAFQVGRLKLTNIETLLAIEYVNIFLYISHRKCVVGHVALVFLVLLDVFSGWWRAWAWLLNPEVDAVEVEEEGQGKTRREEVLSSTSTITKTTRLSSPSTLSSSSLLRRKRARPGEKMCFWSLIAMTIIISTMIILITSSIIRCSNSWKRSGPMLARSRPRPRRGSWS